MITIGKYLVSDWEMTYTRTGPLFIRDVFVYVEHNKYLVSWLRIDQFKKFGFLLSDKWILEICCSTFYNMFDEIHGPNFDKDLIFDSPIDGKEFVDRTLIKLSKLKVFL